jgi:hypothetical protein
MAHATAHTSDNSKKRPIGIRFVIHYSDNTVFTIAAQDPLTIWETLRLLYDATTNEELMWRLERDMRALCISCGNQATRACIGCRFRLCSTCQHTHDKVDALCIDFDELFIDK